MKKLLVWLILSLLFGCFLYVTLHTEKVTAARTVEYKAVRMMPGQDVAKKITDVLNSHAQQGWRFHSAALDVLIFER